MLTLVTKCQLLSKCKDFSSASHLAESRWPGNYRGENYLNSMHFRKGYISASFVCRTFNVKEF